MARTQVYIARNIAPTRTGQTHLNCRAGKDLLAEGVAEAGADALFAYAELWGMLLKQIECEMAQSREVLRPIVALDPTVVRAESYVQHPMASVLNRPMRAYGAGNGLSLCRQRRDEIRRSRPICPSMRRSLSTMSVLEGFGDRQCGEAAGTRSPADQRKRDAVLFRGEADQRVDRQSRAADEAKAEVGRKRPRAEQLVQLGKPSLRGIFQMAFNTLDRDLPTQTGAQSFVCQQPVQPRSLDKSQISIVAVISGEAHQSDGTVRRD